MNTHADRVRDCIDGMMSTMCPLFEYITKSESGHWGKMGKHFELDGKLDEITMIQSSEFQFQIAHIVQTLIDYSNPPHLQPTYPTFSTMPKRFTRPTVNVVYNADNNKTCVNIIYETVSDTESKI